MLISSDAISSLPISGQPAATSSAVAYSLSGAAGSYTYTGQAATFNVGRLLSGAAGAYAYTGQAGTLTYTPGSGSVAYTLSGDAGAYAYTGKNATLTYVSNAPAPTKIGGDDAPRARKHRGFDLAQWRRDKQKPDQALETLIRNAYRRIYEGEMPEEAREEAAQVLAPVIKPRARVQDVPKPAQIDWVAAAMREEIAQWIAQAEQDQDDEDAAAMLLL